MSPGGIGSKYWGPKHGLSAIVFDDQTMTIEVLRPSFDTDILLGRLRNIEFPEGPLDYLTSNEYRG